MGRLSKKPITLTHGVSLQQNEAELFLKGPKGEVRLRTLPFLKVNCEGDTITIVAESKSRQARINQGTMWSLIRNAVRGTAEGFTKTLEITGIGYRASIEGNTLVLSVGYSHPIRFEPPHGVTITVEKNMITVTGADRELVGRAAAEIRAFKKPEPYKGKGIHYEKEVIRRKAGKKVAGTGTAA